MVDVIEEDVADVVDDAMVADEIGDVIDEVGNVVDEVDNVVDEVDNVVI